MDDQTDVQLLDKSESTLTRMLNLYLHVGYNSSFNESAYARFLLIFRSAATVFAA